MDMGEAETSEPEPGSFAAAQDAPPPLKPPKKQSTPKPRDPRTDHPAIQAYRQVTNLYPEKALWDFIIHNVGDTPESLTLWRKVVLAYVALGWNKRNLKNMLEYFKLKEISVQRKNGG